MNKKIKVLSYYAFENKIGGPRTYIRTLEESELSKKYDFVACYQNEAPGGVSFSLLSRMVKTIKQHKPDIVHVHGAQSEGFYGVIASHLAGCHNIVLTIHGFAHDNSSCRGLKYILYRYFVEPITLLLSSKIYTVCKYAANRNIVKLYGGKRCIGHIYNPAPKVNPLISRDTLRKKLGIPIDKALLCIVSRVSVDKGYKTLEKIIKQLNLNYQERFSLLIIGDGEYMPELQENLKIEIQNKQVILIGKTNDVASYLNASDIFIFPTHHENLSIALLEASNAGLPCIANNVGGNSEIIDHEKTGFLIQNNNINSYITYISKLFNDFSLRKAIGISASSRISQSFSINQCVSDIDKIYSSFLKSDK